MASLVGLGLVLAPPGAKAIETPYNAIEGSALAIAAYDASKEQCGYSERLGKAMTDIDAFFARRHGYAWTRAKQSGPDMLIRMRNVGRVLGAQSDCVIYGKAIGYVLPAYLNAVDMEIAGQEREGNREFEFTQRINGVLRLGAGSWQIDGSHRIDAHDVPEIFDSTTYTLTRAGLKLTRDGATSAWVRCQ